MPDLGSIFVIACNMQTFNALLPEYLLNMYMHLNIVSFLIIWILQVMKIITHCRLEQSYLT